MSTSRHCWGNNPDSVNMKLSSTLTFILISFCQLTNQIPSCYYSLATELTAGIHTSHQPFRFLMECDKHSGSSHSVCTNCPPRDPPLSTAHMNRIAGAILSYTRAKHTWLGRPFYFGRPFSILNPEGQVTEPHKAGLTHRIYLAVRCRINSTASNPIGCR